MIPIAVFAGLLIASLTARHRQAAAATGRPPGRVTAIAGTAVMAPVVVFGVIVMICAAIAAVLVMFTAALLSGGGHDS